MFTSLNNELMVKATSVLANRKYGFSPIEISLVKCNKCSHSVEIFFNLMQFRYDSFVFAFHVLSFSMLSCTFEFERGIHLYSWFLLIFTFDLYNIELWFPINIEIISNSVRM